MDGIRAYKVLGETKHHIKALPIQQRLSFL